MLTLPSHYLKLTYVFRWEGVVFSCAASTIVKASEVEFPVTFVLSYISVGYSA